MGTSDQGECRRDGTIYGTGTRLRLPRDRQVRIALAIGAGGVALGAALASGALPGGALSDGRGTAGGHRTGPDPLSTPSAGTAAGLGHPPVIDGSSRLAPAASTSVTPPQPLSSTSSPPGPTSSPAPVAGGIRVFRSVASSLCLAAPADGAADAYQMACSAAPGPRWLPAPVRPDVVALVSVATGRCLAVDVPDRGDSTPVRQRPCAGGEHQWWRLVPVVGAVVADGRTALVNVHSGRCIALPLSPPVGPPLRQTTCRGTSDQQWVAQPLG